MKKFKLILALWLPVIFWAWLIFFLSSIPNLKASTNPLLDEILRKTAHFLEYFILNLLFFRALNWQRERKNFWLPFLLTLFYTLSDEWHQTLVPTRTGRFKDIFIDNFGNLLGGLVIWKLSPKVPNKLKNLAKKWGVI